METGKLKADFHLHTREDPLDFIKYNAEQLIDNAFEMGFDVLSITNHQVLTHNKYLADYARERGILLIPGIELSINRKHVLFINPEENCSEIKTFEDIRRRKDTHNLIVAPHPFFPSCVSLNSKFSEHHDIFDAIEHSFFYIKQLNFNKKGEKKAQELNLPLLGTSDAHRFWQMGKTYSLIEAEKDPVAVIDAIKNHKVEVKTTPLNIWEVLKVGTRLISNFRKRPIQSTLPSKSKNRHRKAIKEPAISVK